MNKDANMLSVANVMTAITKFNSENWKEEIIVLWEESKNFPRKKKKAIRKKLNKDWVSADYMAKI